MKLYTAKVRIAGSLEHEVIKHNLQPNRGAEHPAAPPPDRT